MWDQDKYLQAMNYAAIIHGEQKVPGQSYSYVVHLAEVAQEAMAALCNSGQSKLNADLLIQCALLHDIIEDAGISYQELKSQFGEAIADGVQALTKDKALPPEMRMKDSLDRIIRQPREVWMVKLADRIVNLQRPPAFWTRDKTINYLAEAELILKVLGGASSLLADRIQRQIGSYKKFI
ncbi:MAG: HD domain-containing protein [Syntrophomonadaceae bacterium]